MSLFLSWVKTGGVMWDYPENMTPQDINDFNDDLDEAWDEGVDDGKVIAANVLTFGQIDSLNQLAQEKVCEYGEWGEASQFAAEIGRDAIIAAVTTGATSKFLKPSLINNRYVGRGSSLFGRSRYGQVGRFNTGSIRTGWGWNGSNDVFRTSWAPRGGGSYWNHLDWI